VGQAREIKIRTIWPDGKADDWASYASNAHYILSRGQPLKPWPSN
jgi:hypothetical protein